MQPDPLASRAIIVVSVKRLKSGVAGQYLSRLIMIPPVAAGSKTWSWYTVGFCIKQDEENGYC